MKRTTADGHDGNRYTEGDPQQGIPATVVGAKEMNNIQEEIVNVVLAAGITLDGDDEDQLLEAINGMIQQGGSTQIKIDPLNNNQADQVITGALFNPANIKAARLLIDIERKTDTPAEQRNEVGELFLTYKGNIGAPAWDTPSWVSHGSDPDLNDCECTFNITSAGQLRVSTSDFAGSNYAGKLRVAEINILKQ